MLSGLDAWEIIALAGVVGLGFMAVSATVGATLAWLIYREPAPVRTPVAAAKPALQPTPASAPEYASMTA